VGRFGCWGCGRFFCARHLSTGRQRTPRGGLFFQRCAKPEMKRP
jgi:hypothetical protein